MPKVFLPIALMVLGTIKLPGEHNFSDAEAEHATEQLERLGHGTQAAPAQAIPPSTPVTPRDALETLAAFMERGEISGEEVAQHLGFVGEAIKLRIGMVVEEPETTKAPPEPKAPPTPAEAPKPADVEPKTELGNVRQELVIPPAVVKELAKAGFIITKPQTIQAADDEALLAVKGMTPELLAVVRQIVG